MTPKAYVKTIAQFVVTILAALVAMFHDGIAMRTEWYNIAILAAGTALVFFVPNHPSYPYAKTISSFIIAVLTAASTLFIGVPTWTTVAQALLAGFAAVGVYAFPNTGDMLDTGGGSTKGAHAK